MAETKKETLNLRQKLMRIQTELKAPKNLYNSFGKYKYRNAEGIQEALKPLEAQYNVTVIINDEICEIAGRVYVRSAVTIIDCDTTDNITVSAFAREADAKKGMDEAQVTGATSSYARKYALNALFLLDDTKDVGSEEYQNQSKKATSKKATSKKVETAPAQPEDDDGTSYVGYSGNIRQELVDYCAQHGMDVGEVAKTYKLNNKSSDEEFKTALKRLIVERMTTRKEA